MYGNPYINSTNGNYYSPYTRGYGYQNPQMLQGQGYQQPSVYRSQVGDTPIQGIKFLTADEIKAYIVMPNCKEMLIDKGNGIVHIKSADIMGQSSDKMYKFEEIPENDTSSENKAKETVEINTDNYVKKDDLSSFVKSDDLADFIKQTNEKLERLEKKIKISEIMGEGKND